MPKKVTRSQYAQSVLMLKGHGFNFELHAPFEEVYNWPRQSLLLKTARQVGKSTMLAATVVTDSMLEPNRRTFYATTSERQAREFARVKLNEFLARSPKAREFLLNKKSYDVKDSLFDKNFANGSGITISYMKDNADRTRGYSADNLMLDEIQDMDPNEIPVALEILSASLTPRKLFAGTPKTVDNPIEVMWQRSTQHEIFFKCSGCGSWNDLGYKNIGKVGPICAKCGKLLDMPNYQIVATADNPEKMNYLGVRIPQPALKLHYGYSNKWKDILVKYDEYDEAKFNNEVLGISFSKGTRFITEEDIYYSCQTNVPLKESLTPVDHNMYQFLVAGIDWSGGGIDFSSKTVLTIYGVLKGDNVLGNGWPRLQLVYYKIYPQQDYMITIRDITQRLRYFKVLKTGADAGEGALNNSYLADALGANAIQPFRYGAFDKMAKISQDRYTIYLDKTTVIDDYFKNLKAKQLPTGGMSGSFIFPDAKFMKEPVMHLLSEHEHVTKAGRRIWQRGVYADDFLHASVFAWNTFKLIRGDFKFY